MWPAVPMMWGMGKGLRFSDCGLWIGRLGHEILGIEHAAQIEQKAAGVNAADDRRGSASEAARKLVRAVARVRHADGPRRQARDRQCAAADFRLGIDDLYDESFPQCRTE